MPFLIPNATDTTGSNRYNALDQSEPDSLDFQLLGNRASGVLSGAEVTAQNVANYTVAVSNGYVILNNLLYEVSSNPALSLPSVPANNRFDIVVARLTNGAMSLYVVSGDNSAANPTFPPTPSQMTTVVGVPLNNYVNPDTDVVLAAVYRAGAANITRAHIVDKRVMVSPTTLRGSIVPSNTFGNNGDIYYKNALAGDAGLYVKLDGSWEQVGTGGPSVSAGTPIGAVITWVSSTTNPSTDYWLECNGQALDRTTYSALFNIIGTTYGTTAGTNFKVPDFRGYLLMGQDAGRSIGTTYGNAGNNITLTTSQIPSHTHAVSNIDTTVAGAHTHEAGDNVGVMIRYRYSSTSRGSLRVVTYTSGFTGIDLGEGTTNAAGGHRHTLNGTTTSTGSGATINIEPQNYPVKYYIKYA